MKHIVQFSGGKDSTCMLLMMLDQNMPVDEIIFCDTGKEFPGMYDHIAAVETLIGRKVTVLKAEKSFDYYFAEHIKTKGKGKLSQGYGWARMWVRWCTRLLKQKPTRDYLKNQGEYIQYIGIAADETKRHKSMPKNTVHPLFDWGITEKQALQYCYDRGFEVGDTLLLREVMDGGYTNRGITTKITYILRDCPEYGLQEGYCILGFDKYDFLKEE